MQGILYEEQSLATFLFVTFALGGAAGFLSGRAIARIWQPSWMTVPAAIAVGLGVRFIHFALFDAAFAVPRFFAIDTVIVFAFTIAGYWLAREQQMKRQYGFLKR
jgi:hypothetical protein